MVIDLTSSCRLLIIFDDLALSAFNDLSACAVLFDFAFSSFNWPFKLLIVVSLFFSFLELAPSRLDIFLFACCNFFSKLAISFAELFCNLVNCFFEVSISCCRFANISVAESVASSSKFLLSAFAAFNSFSFAVNFALYSSMLFFLVDAEFANDFVNVFAFLSNAVIFFSNETHSDFAFFVSSLAWVNNFFSTKFASSFFCFFADAVTADVAFFSAAFIASFILLISAIFFFKSSSLRANVFSKLRFSCFRVIAFSIAVDAFCSMESTLRNRFI